MDKSTKLEGLTFTAEHRRRGSYAIVDNNLTIHSFATNEPDSKRLLAAYRAGYDVSNRAGQPLSSFVPELNQVLGI